MAVFNKQSNMSVIALMALVFVAVLCLTIACADAARLPHDPTVFPQAGCRCCDFIWKPMIHCGRVCCEDGCCG
nr:transmembrane protein, putative [Ipomoea batatas]